MAHWITVLSWHTVFTKRVIYKFTFVWHPTKRGIMHRPTSHLAHLYDVPFLWPREEHKWQRSWVDDFAGQCLLWQLSSRKTLFAPTLGLPTSLGVGLCTWFRVSVSKQNFTNGFLLEFDFLSRLLLRLLQQSALFTLLCMTGHSCSNLMPLRYERLLQWQQNRSKATMWLLYKIPAIWGCPRHF